MQSDYLPKYLFIYVYLLTRVNLMKILSTECLGLKKLLITAMKLMHLLTMKNPSLTSTKTRLQIAVTLKMKLKILKITKK